MTFNEVIETIKCSNIKLHQPINLKKALVLLNKIIKSEDEITLVGDWDVDGILSSKIVFDTLLELKPDIKINVYFGVKKTHGIGEEFLTYFKNHPTKYLIITDSSSDCVEELNYLCNEYNTYTLILDHHLSQFRLNDFPNNCIVINPKFDNDTTLHAISAGMLCYIVTSYLRKALNLKTLSDEHLLFGYTTLISDCCDLEDPYCKSIVLNVPMCVKPTPLYNYMLGKYDKLNRKFLNFKFNNKINTLCRNNKSDLIKYIFFNQDNKSYETLINGLTKMEELHNKCKPALSNYVENCIEYVEDLGSCTMLNMDKVPNSTILSRDYLINSTGLIANKIIDKTGKPCISYITISEEFYKCSGRDNQAKFPFGRLIRLLNLKGDGHLGAMGFTCHKLDMPRLKDQIRNLDSNEFQLEKPREIIFNLNEFNPDEYRQVCDLISKYNEVVVNNKMISLKIKLSRDKFKVENRGKLRLFIADNITLKDLKQSIQLDDTVLFKPIFNKDECIIERNM